MTEIVNRFRCKLSSCFLLTLKAQKSSLSELDYKKQKCEYLY
ncbi:MAG: hypothetical protein JWQ40_3920 [Segetibacter sp.]|nr:hypothetical protein [Segetibacter sp.]